MTSPQSAVKTVPAQPQNRKRPIRSLRRRTSSGHTESIGLQSGIAIACALAIIVSQYFHAGALRPALAYPAYGLILLAGALCFFQALSRSSGPPKAFPFLPAIALFLWLAWHCFNTRDTWSGSAYWRQALACMLAFVALACGVSSPKARLIFLGLLFADGTAQVLLAVQQYHGALGISPQGWFSEQLRIWFQGRTSSRVAGLYLNSNHFAWFLNMIGLYALAFTFWGRFSGKMRFLMGVLAISFLTTALFTLSRGGLLALISGYALFLIVSGYTLIRSALQNPKSFLALLGLFVCFLPIVFHEPLIKASGAEFSRFDKLFEDDYRTQLWPIARQRLEEAPLIGSGPGSFVYYARLHREKGYVGDDLYTHNDWLQIAGDYGYIGLGLVTLSLLVLGANGLLHLGKTRRAMEGSLTLQSNGAAVTIGSLAAMTAFIVHSYFDFNLQLPANALLSAAAAGCLLSPRSLSRSGERRRAYPLAAGCLLLVGALAFALYHHRNEVSWLEGENAALKGDYVKACRIAKEAIPRGAPNARLYYLLGDITLQRARLKQAPEGMLVHLAEAESALQKAVAYLPQERLHHLRLAEALLYGAKAQEGRAIALRGIALSPHQAFGYELCGWSYEIEKDFAKAMHCYEQASHLPDQKIAGKRLAYLQSLGNR